MRLPASGQSMSFHRMVGSYRVDEVPDVEQRVRVVGRVDRPEVVHLAGRLVRREVADGPVQPAGVVDAEPQAHRPDRVRDLLDQVPAGSAVHGVAGPGARGVPQRDAVVVLRRGDDVAGAGRGEQLGPGGRVEPFGGPGVEEVVIRSVPIDLAVMLGRWAAGDPDRVAVPLGVRVVPEPVLLGHLAQGAARLGPGGDRVGAPVDEDAQLGLGPPVRNRSAQVGPDRAVGICCVVVHRPSHPPSTGSSAPCT